jgi:hypothetical protein
MEAVVVVVQQIITPQPHNQVLLVEALVLELVELVGQAELYMRQVVQEEMLLDMVQAVAEVLEY